MKSKLIVLSLMLAGSSIASAQETNTKEKYRSESWKDNIFLSVGVGAQACVNPDNFDYGFGKAITPLVNISVGKFITPVWGVRLQVAGWSTKLNTKYPFPNTGNWRKNKETYIGLNADAYVNLTNWFCGYKEGRKFEFFGFVGPTMNFAKNYGSWNVRFHDVATTLEDGSVKVETKADPNKTTPANHEIRCLVGASLGLGGKYNIDNRWAIDLEVRGTVTPSVFDALSSAKTDGSVGINLGATYTFGGKKFVKCGDNGIDQDELNRLINEARAQVQPAEPKIVEKIVEKEVVKKECTVCPSAVFFKIGSAKLNKEGQVTIKLAAKAMKQCPDKKFKLAGYADNVTGSKAINQKLSEKRAQAVYDALIAEGVDAKQLEIVAHGGTDPMWFNDAALNRVVILQ